MPQPKLSSDRFLEMVTKSGLVEQAAMDRLVEKLRGQREGELPGGLLDAGVANDPRARLATGVDHHHLELMLGRDIVAQQVFAGGEIHLRIHDDGDAPAPIQRHS